ncbi:deoxyribodipyrimidine photo-lyase [Candidatus Profftia sp. (ex Adelges kitamiensis)]|uniref:deoxyribodipyrimidine photo-lyase n=1 Tax=Candidatus Profftia sp. (ex Adelges kitamiensis) TaxID=2864218 RepID=UPI001CE32813|nr:deoxyribodipyrimidine photo-lyase [Candidatus Profftia sp. (ex Adelges kitamiensis)]
MTTHLVWFRNDLRITDNRALYEACKNVHAKVLAIYIATPVQWKQHDMSPRQATFIYQNLQYLAYNLAKKNIPLYYHQCDDFIAIIKWLPDFCKKNNIKNIFYNKQYEINERRRDNNITDLLSGICKVYEFDDSLLLPPGSVITRKGEMYKIFTSFRRAFLQRLTPLDTNSLPAPKVINQIFHLFKLKPFDYPKQEIDPVLFPAGEDAALKRLLLFCRKSVQHYSHRRNIPSIHGTSMLSPYLTLGVLSPRQCFNQILIEYPNTLDNTNSGAFIWINELIWREFYRHLLVAYPKLCCHKPFIKWTNNIHWINKDEYLVAWQNGKTGYPIIDAAMRQLNYIGWMHNRLRMIVASFLVKDLLINWREGERYFMSQLLDGDLAANNGGWQWAASSGVDSINYFRIFNPITQGKRFDKDGNFIRCWIPELKDVPNNEIHYPHLWAIKQHLVLDYPKPLVDHALARKHTLEFFKKAKYQ